MGFNGSRPSEEGGTGTDQVEALRGTILERFTPRREVVVIEKWRRWARRLKTELFALYLAYRDPRVSWYARLFAACVVAYAFSPIDLIPDPIPVLGYLDDLLLVPLGIALAIKMIPPDVLAECRARAEETMQGGRPTNWLAAGVVVAIWLLLAGVAAVLLFRAMGG